MKTKFLLSAMVVVGMTLAQCTKQTNTDLTQAEKSTVSSKKAKVSSMCGDCQESSTKITGSQAFNLAWTFSPILKFDRAAPDYPTSVENIWASTNPASIVCNGTLVMVNRDAPRSKSFPTYYEVQRHPNDANKVFIDFWWTYKTQSTCFSNLGGHDYDWEHIVVQVNTQLNKIITVTYFQHGGWYTKDWRNVSPGPRPQVYVGKTAHGSYHYGNSVSFPGYECTYYGDYRNPNGSADEVQTWNTNITAIDCNMSHFGFNGNFGGIGKGPLYRYRAYWNFSSCNGSAGITGTDGCSQSDFPVGTLIGGI
ncbi:MAG: hypothetical protein JWN56_857 [Sphingobacteriales bacterium]|nr:hypothetical protein [Sphingobacteriales bacterium]